MKLTDAAHAPSPTPVELEVAAHAPSPIVLPTVDAELAAWDLLLTHEEAHA